MRSHLALLSTTSIFHYHLLFAHSIFSFHQAFLFSFSIVRFHFPFPSCIFVSFRVVLQLSMTDSLNVRVMFRRNNLTVVEIIPVWGRGAYPSFELGGRRPGSTSPLLFEVSQVHYLL